MGANKRNRNKMVIGNQRNLSSPPPSDTERLPQLPQPSGTYLTVGGGRQVTASSSLERWDRKAQCLAQLEEDEEKK